MDAVLSQHQHGLNVRRRASLVGALSLIAAVGVGAVHVTGSATARPTIASVSRPSAPTVATPITTPVATPVGPARASATATRVGVPTTTVPGQWQLARPTVVLYGDSLSWESADAFRFAFAPYTGIEIVTRAFGGTAICDWLDDMEGDATSLAPGAVVVQFSGNAMTPCMLDANGTSLAGDAYLDAYRRDAEAVISIFAGTGTRVVFAGSPISRAAEAAGDADCARLNAMYEHLALVHEGVEYVDAGASVLDEGRWTATLPCLPGEPCSGELDAEGRPANPVRAPDGNHFCPAPAADGGVLSPCPVWSSGAFRFGFALAAPVIAAIG